MRLAEAAEPIFARHETFHPRYGWFRKAYTTAAASGHGFSEEDAPVKIGVGKNMVRSIKFWGQAAKIITNDPDSDNPRSPDTIPTWFGHNLFSEDGWDPYMEDPGTIWLLHWMLLAPPSHLPVWWLAFNELDAVEFDDPAISLTVRTHLDATSGWKSPSDSSLGKDINVFTRTYAPAVKSGRTSFDDLLDCPLRELGLVNKSVATGSHRFVLGPKPTLPAAVVTFAALDYLARRPPSGKTITLAHLANEPGGPGRAFKLRESDLYLALHKVAAIEDSLRLLSPTGAQQLAWKGDVADTAISVLNRYYHRDVTDRRIGLDGDAAIDKDRLPERSAVMARLFEASGRNPQRVAT